MPSEVEQTEIEETQPLKTTRRGRNLRQINGRSLRYQEGKGRSYLSKRRLLAK